MKMILPALVLFSLTAEAGIPRERFFANPAIQGEAPEAFALQRQALPYLREAEQQAELDIAKLLRGIRSRPSLVAKIKAWKELSAKQREEVLREVFAIEVVSMGTMAPELVIAEGATSNGAFFEFDLQKPGNGKVILSPEKLDDSNYESLAFLIHETRHSSQLQRAFGFEKLAYP